MRAFVLCLALLAGHSALAENEPPLLAAKEIEKSRLSAEEKRLATLSLRTESMINCFAAREQLGGEFERLRIYHLPSGENLAIFKYHFGIRVFVNKQESPFDLAEDYRKSSTSVFSNVGEDDEDLELEFGRVMPGVGKVATATMKDPLHESSLLCFLKQVPTS